MQNSIYLAGHRGLVGSAVLRLLIKRGFKNIYFNDRKKLDLRNQAEVHKYFLKNKSKIKQVIICAATVGGIKANYENAFDFIYDNLMIQNNIIKSAIDIGVKNLIFLGSSCIYPKFAKQPIEEKSLLKGNLEPTNEFYAIAKISGLYLCKAINKMYNTNYKCLMPSNLFGPNDNYNLDTSHFLPAFIKKIYDAKKLNKKKVIFWGTGNPKRELTYVDDIAEAILFFLKKKTKHTLINIGSNYELKLKEYAKIISKKIGYSGKIIFDQNKKIDGTPRKIVSTKIAKSYGWKSLYSINFGLEKTLDDYIKNFKIYNSDY